MIKNGRINVINVTNISENFNKYKDDIINLLVDYYGQENYDLITERIDRTYIDFSSTPTDDFWYAEFHDSEISTSDKSIIRERYESYRKVENQASDKKKNLLSKYAFEKLSIDGTTANEKISFLFLSSWINAFSSKSNDTVATSIKESIKNDQDSVKRLCDSYGIKNPNFPADIIDDIIDYKEKLQLNAQAYIIAKSQYGKEIFNNIKNEWDIELEPITLSTIAFLETNSGGFAGNIMFPPEYHLPIYHFIRVPVTNLLNSGLKSIDVNVIHELVHECETKDMMVGIANKGIINEVRTQKIAIQITKKMHEQGIFIYDNPDDCRIEGESTYEGLFPITEDFIDKYENTISNCAINNEGDKLTEYFGESWHRYCEYINKTYNDAFPLLKYGEQSQIQIDAEVLSIINDMEQNYNNYNNRKEGTKYV